MRVTNPVPAGEGEQTMAAGRGTDEMRVSAAPRLPAPRDPGDVAQAGARRAAVCGAAGAAVALVAATGYTSGQDMAMAGGTSLLPAWLRVVAMVAYGAVLVVHLWHLRSAAVEVRLWHAGHVLMALGMIDMVAPGSAMVVPASVGRFVFTAVAAAVAVGSVAVVWLRRISGLWPAATLDLAAMAYMFAMPGIGGSWLPWLLTVWFAVQALAWAAGWLRPMGCHEGRAGGSVPSSTVGAVPARAVDRDREHSLRITLTVMQAGMAYMFLAVQVGMGAGGGM